jgi:hypothetical protein
MISNPRCGWCTFKLGTFKGTPSYLTDVPLELLDAFLDYHYKGVGVGWFNEEGTEFTLVITPSSLYIIEEKEKLVLHDFSEMEIEKLEKELVSDIESDLEGWVEFTCCEEKLQYNNEIRQRIAKLKKYLSE